MHESNESWTAETQVYTSGSQQRLRVAWRKQFVIGLAIMVALNAFPYFETWGNARMCGGIEWAGCPLVFYEAGGFAYSIRWDYPMLLTDIAVAIAAAWCFAHAVTSAYAIDVHAEE